MKLSDLTIIPSVVVSSDDPKYLGRIKCGAPGVFDTATMPEESLPWAYPFGMSRYQNCSKLFKGTKVWLLKNEKNVNEYWYIPMYEYIDSTRIYMTNNYSNNPDVIISRMGGNTTTQFTCDDANGFKMEIGENYMQISPEGKIELSTGDVKITLHGGTISIGNEDTMEPAVLGNKLINVLAKLEASMKMLQLKAITNPHTIILSDGFSAAKSALSEANDILATNVKIN